MKSVDIFSLGAPPTFNLVVGDPMYWTERASYEISKMMYDLSSAGFGVEKAESSDFQTYVTTFESDFDAWLSSAMEAQADGLPVPVGVLLPSLVSLLPAIISGGWAIVAPVLLRIGVNLLVKYIEKKVFSGGGDNTEALGKIEAALKAGLLKAENLTEAKSLFSHDNGTARYTLADVLASGLVDPDMRAYIDRVLSEYRIQIESSDNSVAFGLSADTVVIP